MQVLHNLIRYKLNISNKNTTLLLLNIIISGVGKAHSSILVWRIPWTEVPLGYSPWGSQRVRHNWSDLAYTHMQLYHMHHKLKLLFRKEKSNYFWKLFFKKKSWSWPWLNSLRKLYLKECVSMYGVFSHWIVRTSGYVE